MCAYAESRRRDPPDRSRLHEYVFPAKLRVATIVLSDDAVRGIPKHESGKKERER